MDIADKYYFFVLFDFRVSDDELFSFDFSIFQKSESCYEDDARDDDNPGYFELGDQNPFYQHEQKCNHQDGDDP